MVPIHRSIRAIASTTLLIILVGWLQSCSSDHSVTALPPAASSESTALPMTSLQGTVVEGQVTFAQAIGGTYATSLRLDVKSEVAPSTLSLGDTQFLKMSQLVVPGFTSYTVSLTDALDQIPSLTQFPVDLADGTVIQVDTLSTSAQTSFIYQSNPTEVGPVDVAILLATLQSDPSTAEAIAARANDLLDADIVTADSLDPIPDETNSNFVEAGEGLLNIFDVAAILARIQVGTDLTALATRINELLDTDSVQASNIRMVPGSGMATPSPSPMISPSPSPMISPSPSPMISPSPSPAPDPQAFCQRIGDPSSVVLEQEYWREGRKYTWMDQERKVWVADVDPVTAQLSPADGRGLFVGQGGKSVPTPYGQVNAVEFLVSSEGATVYFEGRDTEGTPQVFRTKITDPNPEAEQVTAGPNPSAMGSTTRDLTDQPGAFFYYNDYLNIFTPIGVFYQEETSSTPTQLDPDIAESGPISTWVPGEMAIAVPQLLLFGRQVAKFDIRSQTTSVLTLDPTNKIDPLFINAAEFGGEQIFVAQIGSTNETRVYREQDNGLWTSVQSFMLGDGLSFIEPREPFNYRGGTYFFTVVSTSLNPANNGVWLTKIDGSINTKVIDNSGLRQLFDPEYFITSTDELYVITIDQNLFDPLASTDNLQLCRVTL